MSNVQSKFSTFVDSDDEPNDNSIFNEEKYGSINLITKLISNTRTSIDNQLSEHILSGIKILLEDGVNASIIENIEASHRLLSRLLRSSKEPKVNGMTELLRGGCLNFCSVDSYDYLNDKLKYGMRCVSADSLKHTNSKSKCNDWYADATRFEFRTNFVHHKLSNKNLDAFKLLLTNKFFYCDNVQNFRLMFILISEPPPLGASNDIGHLIMDILFEKELYGLPVHPHGILIPILTDNSYAYYKHKYGENNISWLCGLLSEDHISNYFLMSPFLKLQILSRLEEVIAILIAQLEFQIKQKGILHDVNQNTRIQPLTNCFEAYLYGLRLFEHQTSRQVIHYKFELKIDHLIQVQNEQTWESLYTLFNILLETKVGARITISRLAVIYFNFKEILLSIWKGKLLFLKEKACLNFGVKCRYSKSNMFWFDETSDENWADKILWLTMVYDQDTDPLTSSRLPQDLFNIIVNIRPYQLFVIIPGQLTLFLQKAIDYYQNTNNQILLDQWLLVALDILEILLKILQRRLLRGNSNGKSRSCILPGWWNGKSWNDEFSISLPQYNHYTKFNLLDKDIRTFIPRKRMTEKIMEYYKALRSVSKLLIPTGIYEKLRFYLNAFNGNFKIYNLFSYNNSKYYNRFTEIGYESDNEGRFSCSRPPRKSRKRRTSSNAQSKLVTNSFELDSFSVYGPLNSVIEFDNVVEISLENLSHRIISKQCTFSNMKSKIRKFRAKEQKNLISPNSEHTNLLDTRKCILPVADELHLNEHNPSKRCYGGDAETLSTSTISDCSPDNDHESLGPHGFRKAIPESRENDGCEFDNIQALCANELRARTIFGAGSGPDKTENKNTTKVPFKAQSVISLDSLPGFI